MQLEIEKAIFLEAIETCVKAQNPRSPLPVLSHLLLEAKSTILQVTGTDLDLGIRLQVPCKTAQEGALCAPAALLRDIVSKLPAGPVALIGSESRITLRAAKSKFEITILPAEEYPTLPRATGAVRIDLPQKAFRDAIRSVMPAVAKSDESRAVMTGVLVELDGESLVMCSTDGRRLAWTRCHVNTIEKQTVIIPGRTLTEIARACADVEDLLTLRLQDNMAWVNLRNLEMHSRLLEGNFPPWERVMPTEFERFARVSRNDLKTGLTRMLIVAQERQSPNLVVLDFADETLKISANTPDLGLGEEEMFCVYEGPPLRIAFNGRYMLDSLAVLSCEEVHLDMQDDTRSAVLHEGDPNLRHVLMPVRLREAVPEEEAVHA